MSAYETARRLTVKYGGEPAHFKIGDRRLHPEDGLVEIISGCYLDPVYGRLSNFWSWRPIGQDGYGEVKHGYGGEWPLAEERR